MSGEETVPKSPLYTRTGDAGTSSLYSGERRPKDDLIFDALGSLDELNSHIGLARAAMATADATSHDAMLVEIQIRLLDIGASIATPRREGASSRKIGMPSLLKIFTNLNQPIQLLSFFLSFFLSLGKRQNYLSPNSCDSCGRLGGPTGRHAASADHVYPARRRTGGGSGARLQVGQSPCRAGRRAHRGPQPWLRATGNPAVPQQALGPFLRLGPCGVIGSWSRNNIWSLFSTKITPKNQKDKREKGEKDCGSQVFYLVAIAGGITLKTSDMPMCSAFRFGGA